MLWPATGETQAFEGIAADQFIEITDGEAAGRALSVPRPAGS